MESVLGATPHEFESRILRQCLTGHDVEGPHRSRWGPSTLSVRGRRGSGARSLRCGERHGDGRPVRQRRAGAASRCGSRCWGSAARRSARRTRSPCHRPSRHRPRSVPVPGLPGLAENLDQRIGQADGAPPGLGLGGLVLATDLLPLRAVARLPPARIIPTAVGVLRRSRFLRRRTYPASGSTSSQCSPGASPCRPPTCRPGHTGSRSSSPTR